MSTLFCHFKDCNWQNLKLMHYYEKKWLWLIEFAFVTCVGVNERENQISGMEMFRSNIYYYVRIKEYIVHAQDSCACTTLLCMHNTLVRAQHSCACTGGARAQGPDPKNSLVHAQECCECSRILCMHKNLVHAQESCACTIYPLILT